MFGAESSAGMARVLLPVSFAGTPPFTTHKQCPGWEEEEPRDEGFLLGGLLLISDS